MIIAIDPGKSGGIAWLYESEDQQEPYRDAMPLTTADIVASLEEIMAGTDEPVTVFIEEQGPRRGFDGESEDGTVKKTRSTANEWVFAQGYGVLLGIIAALHLRVEKVRPQTWQAVFKIPKVAKTKNANKDRQERKNRLKAKCQELFPQSKWTLKTCDAALLCEYGRRQQAQLAGVK